MNGTVDPLSARQTDHRSFVRELTERPSRRGGNVVSIDSGSGLANATIPQRIVPVRLFYDFLMEEGFATPTRSGEAAQRRWRDRPGRVKKKCPRISRAQSESELTQKAFVLGRESRELDVFVAHRE